MEISRHAIRECAFQTLFALASDPEIDREAIYAERLGLKPDEEVPAYLPELVNGVLAHQDELDAQIESKLAPGWTLSRLARPDLVILRLALYELKYTQVPNAVAINEALRLAHDFSDEKSYRFINGVLGSIESEQN
ncbi:transcription antitermination factor NusB [Limosilactobacillus mucosae]|uniref:transcription antitermination factor NusB n=1 Tax=Limosilactobacillus mucosae TaxID=97478 RepID=UPI0022E35878|nr:transcription antitermination factor NusB [Limosilactobacillus mucosae]